MEFPTFSADLQLRFWARLQHLRNAYLFEALSATVRELDITQLDKELSGLVGTSRLSALAAYSLRGESFYPVPLLLTSKPMLLGYYRLLYGISQKEFYRRPYGRFRNLEAKNHLSSANERLLPSLCSSLIETGWQLFHGIQPVSLQAIHDLQLLTVGPQLRGSENNVIGQDAVRQVFDLVRDLVTSSIESSTDKVITVKNAAGRIVQISFAPDPDITIIELLTTGAIPSVSVEIKGGADVSNIHNRLGEAEKSHQKAKASGFTQFWTIIKAMIDETDAKRESPTTTLFSAWTRLPSSETRPMSNFVIGCITRSASDKGGLVSARRRRCGAIRISWICETPANSSVAVGRDARFSSAAT